jgi:serine/threonine protein kinase
MAEVFKAEHRHLGQIRGLKVLLPEIAAQPELLSRLLTEARTMARLRHPTIAEVYDCDVQGDSAFIVMEYLPGITLRTWCDQVGKLARNSGLAAAIVGTLADGLAFAHQHGVVHRDLKPENVLLIPLPDDDDGFALKILDFGVAKLVREQPVIPTAAKARPESAVNQTQHGCIVGTPLYMAPEQWRPGSAIDHRVDIYALGCVLFELLCGRPPFCEEEPSAIMCAHLTELPPDVTILEPEIGSRFQILLARMLAKSPEDRHPSMEDVLTELESISGHKRSQWHEMLRTPRTGAMAVRGTLVINLQQTIVDRVGVGERLLRNALRLWQARPTPGALSLRLRNLLRWPPSIPRPSGVWQKVMELAKLGRLPATAGRLTHHLHSALLSLRNRMLGTNAARLTVIACASVIAAGGLLWTARLLLPRSSPVPPAPAAPEARPATPAVIPVPVPVPVPSSPLELTPVPAPTEASVPPTRSDRDSPAPRSGSRDRARARHPSNTYRPVDD